MKREELKDGMYVRDTDDGMIMRYEKSQTSDFFCTDNNRWHTCQFDLDIMEPVAEMGGSMKKIGLVGGTGPESTLMYYRELNKRIDNMTDGKAMPDLAIESVNFRRAWNYVVDGDYEALSDYLVEKVINLKKSGAEIIALTAATMHIVFDEVERKSGVKLISIPKAVCEEALSKGYRKVGLLGTIFTMEQAYMKTDLLEAGIEVIVPKEEERELIAKRILEELELGIVKESTLNEFNEIITRMQKEQGIEAVVLGCTELPLLLNDENCPVKCLDSVAIHLNKLIGLV